MDFEKYFAAIDANREKILAVSDAVWETPELAFGEYESAETIIRALEDLGFRVTRNVADIPTAFTAQFGSGKPSIGILAEFDALSALNYEAGKAEPVYRTDAENGHGCGHNLFAAGSLAAAVAVKKYIEQTGNGSVTLFGCPGEETGGGKVYMARAHVFDGVDAVVSWHPGTKNAVTTRLSLANVKVDYSFRGVASHAGGSPQKGRSALDAAELMSVGVNYLREHMDTTSRVHYAYLDVGGEAPNIVQAHSKVRYLIRALTIDDARVLWERVNKIAQGAAMMTETEVTWNIWGAYSDVVTIPTLVRTGDEVMQTIPVPQATEEDLAFGRELRKTMQLTKAEEAGPVYPDRVLPPAPPVVNGGSTDTGDVSRSCPTVQFHIGTWAIGTPAHSWQAVAQGKSPFAHEMVLYAGKVLSGTAIRLMEQPALLEQAKREFLEKTGGTYVCPVPDDVKPNIRPRKGV